jgi:hypothetical protein
LLKDEVPFRLVVVEQERDVFAEEFGVDRLLILPFRDQGLIAVRNWIKNHATQAGHSRHWQLDDNISGVWRFYEGERMYCRSGVAMAAAEDFVDRYTNVAVAGLDYVMFSIAPPNPYTLNCRIYSASLVLNSLPHRWRLKYNDDTDYCLQVLADGWCTVLFHAFLVQKIGTMVIKGGNTDDLYQGDGRLKMSRDLERAWPGVVKTKRRFGRPQHVVKDSWKRFDTQLIRRPDVDFSSFAEVDDYGMRLAQVRPTKSRDLRRRFLGEKPGRPVFVGQAPGRSAGRPLAGSRLPKLLRITPEEFLSRVETVNVLEEWPGKSGRGDAFPLKVARERAAVMDLPGDPVVLVGKNVARAFGVNRDYFEWTEVRGKRAVVIPHPSGVSRWFNSENNQLRFRCFIYGQVLA